MNLSVNLSRESWHYKLQSFIWGENQPILWSLCPYFWFTVLTLVVLPFYLIGKGFGKVQDGIWYLIGPAFCFLGRTIAAFWFLHVEYPMKQTLRQETWEWLKTKDILRALVEIGMANWYGPKVGNTQPKFWGVWLDDYVVYGLMCKMHGSAKMDSYRCLSPYSHKADELERLVRAEKVKKDWRPLWWKPFVMITEKAFTLIVKTLFGGFLLACACAITFMFYLLFTSGKVDWVRTLKFISAITVVSVLFITQHDRIGRAWTAATKYTYKGTSLFFHMIFSMFKSVCPAIDWKEDEGKPEDTGWQ